MGNDRQRRMQPDVHDLVVERVADMLTSKHPGWSAHTNPGSERNLAVGDCWPDVVLVDDTGAVRAVYEVEAEDSVDLAHATQRWIPSGNLGKDFHVVVPEERAPAARRLIRQLQLDVRTLFLY